MRVRRIKSIIYYYDIIGSDDGGQTSSLSFLVRNGLYFSFLSVSDTVKKLSLLMFGLKWADVNED